LNVLLTGVSGFLGTALARRLVDCNVYHLVTALRRGSVNLVPGSRSVVVGDLGGDTEWTHALSNINVVIHSAARVHVMKELTRDPLSEYRKVNVDGTLNLARQAVSANVRRFIFISTIKVNGESTSPGECFTADDQPNPKDSYAISKWETEVGLHRLAEETGMELVIIRPPLVYGPGVKGNFQSMMRWISGGVPLPLGAIYNKRSLVGLENLVDMIVTCIEHPGAANQTFLAGDGEDLSTTKLLLRMGNALGKPARLISVPVGLLALIASLLGKKDLVQRLVGSLQVDISKARELLEWEPPVSVEEGLRRTAEDFIQGQPRMSQDQ
jgi:nucleoside-diphosphate-sugar epimerase